MIENVQPSGLWHLTNVPTRALLRTASTGPMSRMVLDRTGLSGVLNFTLDFVCPMAARLTRAENLPSLQTALQEQLGLKLEPGRGPVEFLVIDHVERPTEN